MGSAGRRVQRVGKPVDPHGRGVTGRDFRVRAGLKIGQIYFGLFSGLAGPKSENFFSKIWANFELNLEGHFSLEFRRDLTQISLRFRPCFGPGWPEIFGLKFLCSSRAGSG